MSFISFQFIVFMAVVTLLYYLVPKKYQWVLLLIASYGFFLYGGVTPLIFILSTTLTVYGGGRWMEHVKATAPGKKAAKATNRRILTLITVFNFGILLMLKYYNFFAESVNHGLGIFAYDSQLPLINIVLPLGISFYTFQSIGYLIDVYRNKYAAEKSLPRFALFISYFPILVQGPISRYNDLGTQLKEEHPFDYKTFKFGMQLALWGFFKKMVIADRIGTAVSTVFGDYAQFDGFQTGLAIILYALQIYLDFSGGIDIARGCSEMLGITLMENFQRPYFGNTVSEYWRRWHIALTSWMRDYVFFPLTLSKFSNKVGKWGRKHIKGSIGKQLPSYFPTFVTFFLIGVWHGAGWGFIVFGLYNATIIVVSMILTPVFQRMIKFFHINEKSFGWKVFQIARTFLIMAAGKTLTRASSVHVAVAMLKRVVGIKTAAYAGASSATAAAAETLASTGATGLPVFSAMGLDLGNWIVLFITFALFFTVSVLQERGMEMRETLAAKPFYVRWIVYLLGFAAVVILGVYGPGYSASEFVYRNF